MSDTLLNFHLRFGSRKRNMDTEEDVKLLIENIEYYRKLMGWTRNRVYLMGAATMIGKDNPAIVAQIAEYISGRPPKEPKESKNEIN